MSVEVLSPSENEIFETKPQNQDNEKTEKKLIETMDKEELAKQKRRRARERMKKELVKYSKFY